MTADRIRGAVLYAGAALLLALGAVWWVRAAPPPAVDPAVAEWKATAGQVLPDPPDPEAGETLELDAGIDREIDADLETGSHHVAMVCVGGPQSDVRVSLGTVNDSGRRLDCGTPQLLAFDVGLAGGLRMNVEVGGAGPVVFRYTVTKSATD